MRMTRVFRKLPSSEMEKVNKASEKKRTNKE